MAKFKVTKRAKQAKQENEEKDDILMNEDAAPEDVQFDEREDEEYIQGKSTRVEMHCGSSAWLTFVNRGQAEAIEGEGFPCPTSEPRYASRTGNGTQYLGSQKRSCDLPNTAVPPKPSPRAR